MTANTFQVERGALYALMRTLFEYPLTRQALEAVQSLDLGAEHPLAAPVADMQANLPSEISDDLVDELNIEMTRLLEGPGQPVAPPYASYYVHGSLMGPVTVQIAETYALWDVEAVAGTQIPPDHIALLFGFLSFLADDLSLADVDDGRHLLASREFLRRYLLPWLPRFTRALQGNARHPFFADLASLASASARVDYEWLMPLAALSQTEEANKEHDGNPSNNLDEVAK
jgi:putative dimethyl sulfoxide reductase chaperone